MSLSMVAVPAFAEASGEAVYDPTQSRIVVKAEGLTGKNYYVKFSYDGVEVPALQSGATATSLGTGKSVSVKDFEASAMTDATMTKENVEAGKWTVNIESTTSGNVVIGSIIVTLTPLPWLQAEDIIPWQLYDQKWDETVDQTKVEKLNEGFDITVEQPEDEHGKATLGGDGTISFEHPNLAAHMVKIGNDEVYKGWVGIGIKELGEAQGVDSKVTAYKYWYWFDKNTEFDTIAETDPNGTEPDGNSVCRPGTDSDDKYDTFFFGVTPENEGKVAFLTVTYTLASQKTVTYTYKLTFDNVKLQTATFVEDGEDEPLAEYMVYDGQLVNPKDNKYTLGGVTEPTSKTQDGKTFKGWTAAEETEPAEFANLAADKEFKAVKYTATWEDEILAEPTAEGLAKGITAANLRDAKADASVPEHDETLYKSYEVTGTQDEQNVNVTINAEGVKAHYAGTVKGNWVGVAIPQVKGYVDAGHSGDPVTEGQVRYSYGWGANPSRPDNEPKWGTTVTKFGRDGYQPGAKPTHDTIYFDAALAKNHNNHAWIKAEYGTGTDATTVVFNITFEGDPLIQTNTVTKVVLGKAENGGLEVTEVWAKDCNEEAKLLTENGAKDTSAVTLTAPEAGSNVYTLSLTDALENPVFAEVTDGTVTFELDSSALTTYGTVSQIAKNDDGEIEFTYAEHKYSVSVKVTDYKTGADVEAATVKLTKGDDVYTLGFDTATKAYVYPAGEAESDLSAGVYKLTVTKGGYEKYEDADVQIVYRTGEDVTNHTAITLTDVKLKNVEDLGDLVCTYDKDNQAIKFAPAEGDTSYANDYKILYKASFNKNDALEIVSDDVDAKVYNKETGIELVNADNNDYLNVNVVAVAIQNGKMSKPAKFTAPTFGDVQKIETVGTGETATAYYSVPVENWVDGLYVAAYYTIDGKPEFTFTQVTNNTEVAVKDGCDSLMFILCVGRSDLSAVRTQMPKFFDIWPAGANDQIPQ